MKYADEIIELQKENIELKKQLECIEKENLELKSENEKLGGIVGNLDFKQMSYIAWNKALTDEELKLFHNLINQKG